MMSTNTNNIRGTLVNLNGKIIPISEAKVSVFDRSFLYGDSAYEVVRTYNGRPFRLRDHLVRLEGSAALCQMQLSQPLEEYEREILKSISAFRAQKGHENEDVYVRLVVSRGSGKIGFGLANVETPTLYVIIVEPITMYPNKTFETGLKLQVSERIRNHPKALDPAAKTGNYMNCMLAYLTSAKAGFDDALMVDQQGFLTEGTTFNVFYVNRGIVATPPLEVGILEGITRKIILKTCIELNIPCREVRFPKEYLYSADEVFITGSVKEIMPVTQIDQKKIAQGKAGPVSHLLSEALIRIMNTEASGQKEVIA